MKNCYTCSKRNTLNLHLALNYDVITAVQFICMQTVTKKWIAGTTFVAVLMNFIMLAVFGFNLPHWIYWQVLYWVREREYVEEVY